MKKIFSFLFFVFTTITCWGQIVTSNPAYIPSDYTGQIVLTYDATQGTAGLKDYLTKNPSGTVYAHIGVITNASTNDTDWKHAPSQWGDNSLKYKCTSLGNNKWQLTIPNMVDYFGLTTGEVVKKIAIVYRSGEYYPATGTSYLEGKDTGAKDIFVTVGFVVEFTTPSTDGTSTSGTKLPLKITSTLSSALNLKVNGASIATRADSTSLTTSYTFASTGDFQFIALATANSTTVYDTLNICVPNSVTSAAVDPSSSQLGINYIDNNTVTLVFNAPNKTNVLLIGDVNSWIPQNAYQLKKDPSTGYWWIKLTGLTAGKLYRFQYLVDGSIRSSDPYTELVLDPWNDQYINYNSTIYPNLPPYPTGKTTGLVATFQTAKTTYNWEVSNFSISSKDNLIIYELLLRDFTTEKSLNAAITKLDYLKTLGITAIELMPIQEFDGNDSWGYNPNHFFAPDKAYGTSDTYKKFIDECHKRGIAVILDMVFNQATGICPFALLYWDSANNRPAANNPWMNPVAPHAYSVFNDFNHESSYTRAYFKRVLQYWLTEYKVDGYRMDLAKGFTQNNTAESYDASRIAILKDYYNTVMAANPNAIFILEHLGNSSEQSEFASAGIYLWSKNSNAYSQAAMGYSGSSGFGGMISSPRQWVGYAESHDELRNFYKVKIYGAGNLKTDSISRVARVPLVVAFATLLPGPKMLWEFEEMGYDYSGGEGDTSNKPSAWGWLDLAHRKDAYDKCSKIITLRKNYSNAFTYGTWNYSVNESDWSQGRRIALTHSDLNMIVVGNFDATSTVTVNPLFQKTGTWYELLTGEELNVSNTAMTLQLASGELRVYTDRKVPFTGVDDVKATIDCTIYPNVTKGKIWITTVDAVKSVRIFNTQGALQKVFNDTNEIDVTPLGSGLYLMEVSTGQGKSIQKFVKQ